QPVGSGVQQQHAASGGRVILHATWPPSRFRPESCTPKRLMVTSRFILPFRGGAAVPLLAILSILAILAILALRLCLGSPAKHDSTLPRLPCQPGLRSYRRFGSAVSG